MKKVFFLGIGGIGMSALARYYASIGYAVFGSDDNESELIQALKGEGMHVNDGTELDASFEKVIYTVAIQKDNKVLRKAGELGIGIQTYPEALGEMTNSKKVIAVCGTHGKTTTTAMAYFALQNAGLDCSMIVGSLISIDGKKTNYVRGASEWIVIEACEYRRSFLNYNPDVILVTNVDNDHLDYFKGKEDIVNAFQEFANRIKNENGALIIHEEENFLDTKAKKIICDQDKNKSTIVLNVPGEHNRKNAELVVALGEYLMLDRAKILEGLKNFKGTWRRQEYKGEFFGAQFYDDYAHHPTELKATLNAFREKYPENRIIAIFQPHLYSRTKLLFKDFIDSFDDADKVLILPIYAAREKFDPSITSGMLVEEINKKGKKGDSITLDSFPEYFKDLKQGDVVVTLGAGDVNKLYSKLY